MKFNIFSKTRIFVIEMVDELKKCTWPTRAELVQSTGVVIFASLLLGLFTSICDFSLYQLIALCTKLVS
ncbi:preprotein translocase subunit SecE [Ereboglobus sp. PH5-5]|uniref:Protein translocase subunit SecE n=1 Tax=Ereboglobus luteus TaxID=1796921 RepID=A0A2U8E2A1_9BACT|nr:MULTISPECIES: preprotein translocase subunit SecE [Ereboglobus]AWI08997.1 preprotein translocase subunit SecE [Ereboglobus luteus]MDF9828445.1 preprotein translocase subunit SecE [Ereboglobus sp. PH5-10]MDF9834342.1 preprotein translocase subunit SecE [Ereboglobus sp. PH5-5]